MRFLSIFVFLCFIFNTSHADARRLSEKKVEAFIKVEKALQSLAAEMKEEGAPPFQKAEPMFMAQINLPFYEKNLASVKNLSPQYYNQIRKIIINYDQDHASGYRFRNPEEWAEVGDRVMLAHNADVSPMTLAQYQALIEKLTPEAMMLFRPQSETQVQDTLNLFILMENVSRQDLELVKAYRAELGEIATRLLNDLTQAQMQKVFDKMIEQRDQNKSEE